MLDDSVRLLQEAEGEAKISGILQTFLAPCDDFFFRDEYAKNLPPVTLAQQNQNQVVACTASL